jgi:hypothetical protein
LTKRLIEERLPDPNYRRAIASGSFERENNPWLNMMNSYEWVGSLVKHRLIPEEPFMDVYSARILKAWTVVEPVFAVARRGGDPSLWENFDVPRLAYRDVWQIEDNAPAPAMVNGAR